MTKNELKKLRSKLPKNGIKLICEKTGFSRSYVNYVLNGERSQQLIIDKAIEIAIEHKNGLDLKSDLIKTL